VPRTIDDEYEGRMPSADDIRWFKENFQQQVELALAGTPLSVDLLAALACQETGEVWPLLRKKGLAVQQILALCVGDTLDEDRGRRAFPKNKSELMAVTNGQAMLGIAQQALRDMAQHIDGYAAAARKSHKFCRGYGMFQYDLQFFKVDPAYFLEQRYAGFDGTLGKCLLELKAALKQLEWQDKSALTDEEAAALAIAYNTGGYKPSKGLRQGYFDGRHFYGEQIFQFLRLAKTVAAPGVTPVLPMPVVGSAILPLPTPVAATGSLYVVDTEQGTLNLRTEPAISAPNPNVNVRASLPDGHLVRAITEVPRKGFLEVETTLAGANLTGFVATKFLKSAAALTEMPEPLLPAAVMPTTGVTAILMPRKAGTLTRRSEDASAHSLNEPNQPSRQGTTPVELCAELGAIVDWLAVEKSTHKRYQIIRSGPRVGSTFCNIYAHDYCALAGAYLPRVWWTPKAIEQLALGNAVQAKYGDTVEEIRANGLFRWLRDFGPRFGWRQTGTLTKLQQAANVGGIGLIVARRTSEGASGHIVMVVPESKDHAARRNAAGEVIAPLQSQAGITNFRYGTGKVDWWRQPQYAESALWIHS
jgi:hypothetical protein